MPNTNKDTLIFLETLGLSDIEIKIYLTLLEKGGQSVQELARVIGMNRTTLYSYINSLLEKGLVVRMVRGERTLFAINDIDKSVTSLVEDKLEAAQEVQNKLPDMLQKIKGLSAESNDEIDNFEIKYYKGKNGLKKIYEDALRAKELDSYVHIFESNDLIPDVLEMFENAFKHNSDLTIREIVFDSPFARQETTKISQLSERYTRKFMPEHMKFESEDILIYDGKVAILHAKGDKVNSVVLQNEDYYKNSKQLFDFVWRTLS